MYPIAKGIDNYLNSEKLKQIKISFLKIKDIHIAQLVGIPRIMVSGVIEYIQKN